LLDNERNTTETSHGKVGKRKKMEARVWAMGTAGVRWVAKQRDDDSRGALWEVKRFGWPRSIVVLPLRRIVGIEKKRVLVF
jgi:hypothetical protein